MHSVTQALQRYSRFLPESLQGSMRPPTSSWWLWRELDVHVLRDRRPQAPLRMIVVHGAAVHSAAVYPLIGLTGVDCDVAIPDLPLYGKTQVPHPDRVTYQDWVDLLCDFVAAEDDDRPLILLGTSVGGLVAYEVAARTGKVAALVVTCLMDVEDFAVRSQVVRSAFFGRHAPTLLRWTRRWLDRVPVPITLLADASVISKNPELAEQCVQDPLGGGARVPLGFLATWLSYKHTPPEAYDGPQILLVHPQEDAWVPIELSEAFLARVPVPSRVVLLPNCGHFPVEQPGLNQLRAALQELAASLTPPQAPSGEVERTIDIRDSAVHPGEPVWLRYREAEDRASPGPPPPHL